ncbi:MAG TPA: BatA domain-containing protein, partial [Tepidisphaeraceae bacterium]|nr:BatA domain-containing protein [Tepidisphaeraceae bacterium]
MFLNPVMLAGAGAAVVPLVLHFLSRSRFRTVDWGGMMFLGEPGDRRWSGGRVRQWVLLLLRMGILGLLAVAMARPVVAKLWGDRSEHRLIVLVMDCSGSMAVGEAGGQSRMNLAKEAALRVLARGHAADRAALVEMGAGGVKTSPVEEIQQITGRIDKLHSGAGMADVARGLLAAAELCDRRNLQLMPGAEIYVIADRQARSWEGIGDSFATAWQGRWSMAKGARARVYVVPVGREGVVENLGVESLEITDGVVVRGQPVGVEVRVHNYGGQSRAGVPVTI